MDIPELIGTWTGPVTSHRYTVIKINRIILVHEKDRNKLLEEHGQNKLPIV